LFDDGIDNFDVGVCGGVGATIFDGEGEDTC